MSPLLPSLIAHFNPPTISLFLHTPLLCSCSQTPFQTDPINAIDDIHPISQAHFQSPLPLLPVDSFLFLLFPLSFPLSLNSSPSYFTTMSMLIKSSILKTVRVAAVTSVSARPAASSSLWATRFYSTENNNNNKDTKDETTSSSPASAQTGSDAKADAPSTGSAEKSEKSVQEEALAAKDKQLLEVKVKKHKHYLLPRPPTLRNKRTDQRRKQYRSLQLDHWNARTQKGQHGLWKKNRETTSADGRIGIGSVGWGVCVSFALDLNFSNSKKNVDRIWHSRFGGN